jgi:uncharacterized protein YbbC (DUF1343 family)
MLRFGIERLASEPSMAKTWGRCALLCNQASVTQNFEPAWAVLHQTMGSKLTAFFGPQHGFHATLQDNMIESVDATGPFSLPVYSLYSRTREPTDRMLEGVDTIVIDLQIVGCRVYTFKYTIAACLRAAKRTGKKVVVLDRPNPVGGQIIEGIVLQPHLKSFVGEFLIPLRHGLSVGEAALFFNREIEADLEIVAMDGWQPVNNWQDHGLPWVLTSPNLPSYDSVAVYPATVLFEGTNISEGRGTGLPFQFVGAPYLNDPHALISLIKEHYNWSSIETDGVFLRPAEFQPTSQKWAGETCRGLQLHVLEPSKIRTFELGVCILRAFIELCGDKVQWKQPPYEYDFETLPLKLILGSEDIVEAMTTKDFDISSDYWKYGLREFKQVAERILIYDRELHID